jgi:hypothetical protein
MRYRGGEGRPLKTLRVVVVVSMLVCVLAFVIAGLEDGWQSDEFLMLAPLAVGGLTLASIHAASSRRD